MIKSRYSTQSFFSKKIDNCSSFWGIVIIAFFAISKVFEIKLLAYLGFFLAILYAFLGDAFGSVLLVFLLIPNTGFEVIDGNSICGFYVIAVVLKHSLLGKFHFKVKRYLPLLCFFTLSVLSAIINDSLTAIVGLIKVVFFFGFMYIILDVYDKHIEIFLKNYVLGVVIGGVFGLFNRTVRGEDLLTITRYERFLGLSGDPNYYSAIVVFAISILLFLLLKNGRPFLLNSFALLFLAFCGLASLSRGFLVSLLVVLTILALHLLFSKSTKHYLRIGIIVVVLLSFWIINKYTNITAMIAERLQESSLETGNGRIDIWNWYLRRVGSSLLNILIGCGEASIAVNKGLVKYIEHNTYIQVLYEVGAIGFVLFFYSFIAFYKEANRGKKNEHKYSLVSLMPLLSVVCSYLFLSQMRGENFIICLLLSLLVISRTDSLE